MKIELGKRYRLNNGEIADIMTVEEYNGRKNKSLPPNISFPYVGAVVGSTFMYYNEDGKSYSNSFQWGVKEEIKVLELKVGNTYIDNEGAKLTIIAQMTNGNFVGEYLEGHHTWKDHPHTFDSNGKHTKDFQLHIAEEVVKLDAHVWIRVCDAKHIQGKSAVTAHHIYHSKPNDGGNYMKVRMQGV